MKYSVETYTYHFLCYYHEFRLLTRTISKGNKKCFLIPISLPIARAEEFEISKSVAFSILSEKLKINLL